MLRLAVVKMHVNLVAEHIFRAPHWTASPNPPSNAQEDPEDDDASCRFSDEQEPEDPKMTPHADSCPILKSRDSMWECVDMCGLLWMFFEFLANFYPLCNTRTINWMWAIQYTILNFRKFQDSFNSSFIVQQCRIETSYQLWGWGVGSLSD